MTSELPLIVYTIMMQLAVGSFIAIELVRFFAARKSSPQEAGKLTNRVVFSLGPIAVIGVLGAFFHLEVPLFAPYTLLGAATSWMSREILLTTIFTALVIAYSIILLLSKLKLQLLKTIFAAVTSVVGLALIYCMARAYMMPTFPAWDTLATPFSFYATTILLGAVFSGAALALNYYLAKRKDPDCAKLQCSLLKKAVKWVTLVAAVALGIGMVIIPLHLSSLALGENPAALASLGLWVGEYGIWFAIRLAFVFVGAGILGIFVYRNAVQENQELQISNLIYVAFALVFVSEILGRFLFYATAVSIAI